MNFFGGLHGRGREIAAAERGTKRAATAADGASTENLSLDGQGRVEDHWIQTELDGVTYLDTEGWRAEPLLGYLTTAAFVPSPY